MLHLLYKKDYTYIRQDFHISLFLYVNKNKILNIKIIKKNIHNNQLEYNLNNLRIYNNVKI